MLILLLPGDHVLQGVLCLDSSRGCIKSDAKLEDELSVRVRVGVGGGDTRGRGGGAAGGGRGDTGGGRGGEGGGISSNLFLVLLSRGAFNFLPLLLLLHSCSPSLPSVCLSSNRWFGSPASVSQDELLLSEEPAIVGF